MLVALVFTSLLVGLSLGLPTHSLAQSRSDTIVTTGDVAPDSNGTFGSNFSGAVINDDGRVAFYSVLTGTAGATTTGSRKP